MLLVDDRIGSRDLLVPLRNFGVPVEMHRLDSADFAFIGRGIEGADIFVGIELKETTDLAISLSSGRLAGDQLPALVKTYDSRWLLTEGIWRADSGGLLEVFQQGWKYPCTRYTGARQMELHVSVRDMEKQLLTIVLRGGLQYHHCNTRADTIRWLSVLYHWFVDKDMDEHRSHLTFHAPFLDRALLETPSMCRLVAKELPKIGWTKSAAVEAHFGKSTRRMVNATQEEWREIDGIGKTIAQKIDLALG